MRAVYKRKVGISYTQKDVVEAVVVSSTAPTSIPIDGSTVDGMTENEVFAPMSVLYIVANVTPKIYVANEQGQFVGQTN